MKEWGDSSWSDCVPGPSDLDGGRSPGDPTLTTQAQEISLFSWRPEEAEQGRMRQSEAPAAGPGVGGAGGGGTGGADGEAVGSREPPLMLTGSEKTGVSGPQPQE